MKRRAGVVMVVDRDVLGPGMKFASTLSQKMDPEAGT
jgi:hypothetical protein